jgi:hypothetical protein
MCQRRGAGKLVWRTVAYPRLSSNQATEDLWSYAFCLTQVIESNDLNSIEFK